MPASSLYDCAVSSAIRYAADITSFGSIPYELVAPILSHIHTANQLAEIESNSPQIIGYVDNIWKRIFERDFRGEDEWSPPDDPQNWYALWQMLWKAKTEREEAIYAAFAAKFPIASQVRDRSKTILVNERDLPKQHISDALGKMRSNIRASNVTHGRLFSKQASPWGAPKAKNPIMKQVHKSVKGIQTARRLDDRATRAEKVAFAQKRQQEKESVKPVQKDIVTIPEKRRPNNANMSKPSAAFSQSSVRSENLGTWRNLASKPVMRKASPPVQQKKASKHKREDSPQDHDNVSDVSSASSTENNQNSHNNHLKRKASQEVPDSADDGKAQAQSRPKVMIRRPKKPVDPFLRKPKDAYRKYGNH